MLSKASQSCELSITPSQLRGRSRSGHRRGCPSATDWFLVCSFWFSPADSLFSWIPAHEATMLSINAVKLSAQRACHPKEVECLLTNPPTRLARERPRKPHQKRAESLRFPRVEFSLLRRSWSIPDLGCPDNFCRLLFQRNLCQPLASTCLRRSSVFESSSAENADAPSSSIVF